MAQMGVRAIVPGLPEEEDSERPAEGRVVVISTDLQRRCALVEAVKARGFFAVAGPSLEEEMARGAHLFFVDLSASAVDAVNLVQRLVRRKKQIPVVVICERDDEAGIIAAIRAGARGCLYADEACERIARAAVEALCGGYPMSRGMAYLLLRHIRRDGRRTLAAEGGAVGLLTERERMVLRQMATGQTYEDMGRAFGLSVNTVRTHVRGIYEKLEVNSRTEAVVLGTKLGIIAGTL
jgi:DNA-binding NarL/FixJ family response regulator